MQSGLNDILMANGCGVFHHNYVQFFRSADYRPWLVWAVHSSSFIAGLHLTISFLDFYNTLLYQKLLRSREVHVSRISALLVVVFYCETISKSGLKYRIHWILFVFPLLKNVSFFHFWCSTILTPEMGSRELLIRHAQNKEIKQWNSTKETAGKLGGVLAKDY